MSEEEDEKKGIRLGSLKWKKSEGFIDEESDVVHVQTIGEAALLIDGISLATGISPCGRNLKRSDLLLISFAFHFGTPCSSWILSVRSSGSTSLFPLEWMWVTGPFCFYFRFLAFTFAFSFFLLFPSAHVPELLLQSACSNSNYLNR